MIWCHEEWQPCRGEQPVSETVFLRQFNSSVGFLYHDRQRCSQERALKAFNKNMLTSSWCGQLSQRFYSISLTHNENLEKTPLTQHYHSTGGLIIFHEEAAERFWRQIQYVGKTGFSSVRANAVKPALLYIDCIEKYTPCLYIWNLQLPQWTHPDSVWADINNLTILRMSETQAFGWLRWWNKNVYNNVWHSESCLSPVEPVWSSYWCAVIYAEQDRRDHKRSAVWPTFGRLESAAHCQV